MFEKFEVEFVVFVMGVFGTRNGQMTNLIGAMGECQSEIKVSAFFLDTYNRMAWCKMVVSDFFG